MSNLRQTDGTVGSIGELDQDTLTICHYIVQYGGTFGNDPYLDSEWIKNDIRCEGYEPGNYNTIYVSENDARYTGNREPIWGTWEYSWTRVAGTGTWQTRQIHAQASNSSRGQSSAIPLNSL